MILEIGFIKGKKKKTFAGTNIPKILGSVSEEQW